MEVSFRKYGKLQKENDKLVVVNEKDNLGGAAGFNHGIKRAMLLNADGIWVMDDDTIPDETTLTKLIDARKNVESEFESWGVLASNVRWVDGSAALMNVPQAGKPWNQSSLPNLISISHSSFVSMYINAKAIRRLGLPISDFFIWGDDVEFSERIARVYPSFCVTNSNVLHKMAENQKVDILTDNKGRIPRYFYDVRNKIYIAKKSGSKACLKYAVHFINVFFKVLFKSDYKRLKLSTMLKELVAGITFNPKIERVH
ncbi:glycosyltransferase [Lactiplantibacillus plantarum]|uniref:glycosyltransferase n=1 Tax=Lactiplantibacillus plantarum TaxID=1590 RepID=UPI0025B3DD4B|nr:glycosyltransferase [Lactiplantibacillus plantarum]MDN3985558.1 glycosyltransferase [Lactiplantibacillus plantarum]